MAVSTSADAAVIMTSQFTQSNSGTFNEYLNYLDRDEAKNENDFASYNDYMDDDRKSTSLFTFGKDKLNEKDKENIKKSFTNSQRKGSIMWQDVISFDNQWLKENGVYDSKTNTVNEVKLKDITRDAMGNMLDKNNITSDAIWTGSIHYNTDNIHIHLATVELNPKKERGKRTLSSLEDMKSQYVNKIMDRSKEHKKISNLIRNDMVNDFKDNKTFKMSDRKLKKDFKSIYNNLPSNKRYWNYGYQNINHVKEDLNNLTTNYINKYYKKEFKQLNNKLDEETKTLKEAYGSGQKKRYEDFKQNKINDLYKRMGNAFLQEMKEYSKSEQQINNKYSDKSKNFRQAKKQLSFQQTSKQMKYGMDKIIYSELKTNQNQAAYQKHLNDMERGQSM